MDLNRGTQSQRREQKHPFGNAYLIDGIKNFAFDADNGMLVFMACKCTEEPCTAFALSIAIIAVGG
jgi:hypothetical protein